MAKAAPRGLSVKGRKLWRDVTSQYQLRVDELRVLEDACREVDIIERLEDEMEDAPLTVHGSMGQPVANPLIQELRMHRSVLARLLGNLKFPDAPAAGGAVPTSASSSARALAAQRWGRRSA